MTEDEKIIFWKLDDKLYSVEHNKTYKKIFYSFDKFNSRNNIQILIDKLIAWYGVKYCNNYVELIFNGDYENIDHSLVEMMSFEKLKYRIDDFIDFSCEKNSLYCQYLIVMAGWGLIYDRKSNPTYGLFRVSKMLSDFNNYYGWNLNTNVYETIVNFDYSKENPMVLKLLENRKHNNNKEKNKLSKIKKLFRR